MKIKEINKLNNEIKNILNINKAKESLQALKNFDFVDLILGDGECIFGNGKETLEEFLNQ